MCFPGASSGFRPSHGSEDEQAEQQPGEHAERGAANEPALPSVHTQVGNRLTEEPNTFPPDT